MEPFRRKSRVKEYNFLPLEQYSRLFHYVHVTSRTTKLVTSPNFAIVDSGSNDCT